MRRHYSCGMCWLVGAGMDGVQRLQGHDASVPGHGGAEEVLPLPVLQHLQGRALGAPGLASSCNTPACILLRLPLSHVDR